MINSFFGIAFPERWGISTFWPLLFPMGWELVHFSLLHCPSKSKETLIALLEWGQNMHSRK